MPKAKCSCLSCGFQHHPATDFTKFLWQKSEKIKIGYLVYRLAAAVLMDALLIYDMTFFALTISEWWKYSIFFSAWVNLIIILYFNLSAVVVILQFVKEKKHKGGVVPKLETMPWYYQLLWVSFTQTLTLAILLNLVFWIKIYDPEVNIELFTTILEHGINLFFVLIDYMFVAYPMRLSHFYLPALPGLIYFMITPIYQGLGGKGIKDQPTIDKILNWENPVRAVLTGFFYTGTAVGVHILLVFINKGKLKFYKTEPTAQNIEEPPAKPW